MGFLDDINPFGAGGFNPLRPITGVAGALSGKDEAEERADQRLREQGISRQQAKQKQYDLLGQMQGPSMTPAMERRLRALEEQSQPSELSQDPYFQASRANLVQGGQQALSGVQNKQAAYNTQGGFRNQGSINDVYDRLGAQMAQLGQQSVGLKDQKAMQAAQARQQFDEAQISYQNAQVKAKMAIESGDTQAALAALQQAYAARDAAQNAQAQMTGSLVSAAIAAGTGGMSGAPKPPQSQQSYSNMEDPFAAGQAPSASSLQQQPWSAQKRSYSLGGS